MRRLKRQMVVRSRPAAWIAAATLAVFVSRLGLHDSGDVGISFLYLVPVGLASWWFGLRAGVAVAAGCIGLYVLTVSLYPVDHVVGSTIVRSAVLLAAAVIAAELSVQRRRLGDATDELHALRQALTPAAIPSLPGLDVAVKFLPAEHGVSGDFYLVTNGPRGTNIAIVGDVCGHGPAAAQRATFARATLASVAASAEDPAEILRLVNATLLERWADHNFLTATCISHDPAKQTVVWATAGHPRPIRLGDLTELGGGGPLLGVLADAQFPAGRASLEPAEGLVLYTDGLLDAKGEAGSRFGRDRLEELLAGCAGSSAAEIVEVLSQAVRSFAAGALADDVCVMVLRSRPLAR
jgi:serine phosphatase RsbU (regulator of sigma subunit)